MIEQSRLTELSKEYLLAKERYEQAVRIKLRTAWLPPDFQKTTFWDMLNDMNGVVLRYVSRRDDPVRYGIEEWLKEMCIKGGKNYNFDDVPAFIYAYSRLKESISRKLRVTMQHLKENNGDYLRDSFCDAVDSIPLAGKQACLEIIYNGTEDRDGLRTILWNSLDAEPGTPRAKLVQSILYGENSVEQWLEQAYANRLCETLAFSDEGFSLELENANP